MPSEVPPTPKGRRTFQQLVDSAAEVFGANGYMNARVSDIAAAGGHSLGTFYRYFDNKEDVFEHLLAAVHEELYTTSRGGDHDFVEEPFDALWDANYAYLDHYSRNRGVMRALVEASAGDERFRRIWWKMRTRHAERFTQAMTQNFGVDELAGVSVASAADAMTCLVEQVAYVWYANSDMHEREIPLKEAAEIVTRSWYRLFFHDPDQVGTVDPLASLTNSLSVTESARRHP